MLFQPLKPMLVSMGKESFDDDNYIFEPKWDGWRILLHKDGQRIEAFTRNGNRVTDRFPELQSVAASIRRHSAIIDCEGICMRDDRPNFDDFSYRGRLQDANHIHQATQTHPASFVAFDVLMTDGHDHTKQPLMERKHILADTVETSASIMPTMYVDGRGRDLHQLTIERELEGIVCKRKDSLYKLDTRSPHWTKVKNWKTLDTVILGYRLQPTFGLIIGAHFRTIQNKPMGVVEWGFKPEEKQAFLAVAKQIHMHQEKNVQWIEPRLCCRIEYQERTDNHMLRTTVFRGFLFDKLAAECEWVS